MHVNVSDILAGEVGARTSLEITDERSDLPDLALIDGLNGQISLTKTDSGLLLRGQIKAQVELECHRCLRVYSLAAYPAVAAEYQANPADEQWPISAEATIDLAPLLRQEILINLPIKQICRSDCLGLCPGCGQIQTELHRHPSVGRRPAIRFKQKGLNHGST